jgi:hypothetical protein
VAFQRVEALFAQGAVRRHRLASHWPSISIPVSFLYSRGDFWIVVIMGRVDKGVSCSMSGCENKAERSISGSKAAMAPDMGLNSSKHVYLCHEHYKEWKKATKEDRENERARWG